MRKKLQRIFGPPLGGRTHAESLPDRRRYRLKAYGDGKRADERSGGRLLLVNQDFTDDLLAGAHVTHKRVQHPVLADRYSAGRDAEVLAALSTPGRLREVEGNNRATEQCRGLQEDGPRDAAVTLFESGELLRARRPSGILEPKLFRCLRE